MRVLDSVFEKYIPSKVVKFSTYEDKKGLTQSLVINKSFTELENSFDKLLFSSLYQTTRSSLVNLRESLINENKSAASQLVTELNKVSYVPNINNTLWWLWQQGWNLGNKHGLNEINKLKTKFTSSSNFNTFADFADEIPSPSVEETRLKRRTYALNKRQGFLDKQEVAKERRNTLLEKLVSTTKNSEKAEIQTKIESLNSEILENENSLIRIDQQIKRIQGNESQIVTNKNTKKEAESKKVKINSTEQKKVDNLLQSQKKLLESPRSKAQPVTSKSRYQPYVSQIREKDIEEKLRTLDLTKEPLNTNQFGEQYLSKRNLEIAQNYNEQYKNVINTAIYDYFSQAKNKTEKQKLFNDLISREKDLVNTLTGYKDEKRKSDENLRTLLNPQRNRQELNRLIDVESIKINDIEEKELEVITKIDDTEKQLNSAKLKVEAFEPGSKRGKQAEIEVKRLEESLNTLTNEKEYFKKELLSRESTLKKLEKSNSVVLTKKEAQDLGIDYNEIEGNNVLVSRNSLQEKFKTREEEESKKAQTYGLSDKGKKSILLTTENLKSRAKRIATTELTAAYNLGRVSIQLISPASGEPTISNPYST